MEDKLQSNDAGSSGKKGPASPKIRKLWQVLVHNRPYWVYSIEGKEHHKGSDYWLYYNQDHDQLCVDGVVPNIDARDWEPWTEKAVPRIHWEISYKELTTSKVKWDETRFTTHCKAEVKANGKLFLVVDTFGDMAYVFARIQYMIVAYSEHSFNFFDPMSENGRAIYYHGLPANIEVRDDSYEIMIHPNYEDEGISRREWWHAYRKTQLLGMDPEDDDFKLEVDYLNDYDKTGYINHGSAYSDKHIKWHRKIRKKNEK